MSGSIGGTGKPVSAKSEVSIVPLALGISFTCGIDFCDEARLCGDGDRGDGAGEWLLPEYEVGETSAIGDDVFQPKKEVSLLGPGDRGVFVMIVGSTGS